MGKTKFVIRCDDEERQLFSVTEAADGHLTIALSALHAALDKAPEAITQFKISVHNSANANPPGRTIHTSVIRKNGEKEDYHNFVHTNDHAPLCTPAFILMAPSYELNSHRLKEEGGDRIIRLEAYRSKTATHIAMPMIVEKSHAPPKVQGLSINVIEFEIYNIAIYSTFLQLPTNRKGNARLYNTRPRRLNGVPESNEVDRYNTSVDLGAIEAFIQDDISRLAFASLSSNIRSSFRGGLFEFQAIAPAFFKRWPDAMTAGDWVYGLNARGDHTPTFSPFFVHGEPKPPGARF